MNDDCPCKGCVPPKRNAYCHGKGNCKEFSEWSEKENEKKLDIIKKKETEQIGLAYHCRRCDKLRLK